LYRYSLWIALYCTTFILKASLDYYCKLYFIIHLQNFGNLNYQLVHKGLRYFHFIDHWKHIWAYFVSSAMGVKKKWSVQASNGSSVKNIGQGLKSKILLKWWKVNLFPMFKVHELDHATSKTIRKAYLQLVRWSNTYFRSLVYIKLCFTTNSWFLMCGKFSSSIFSKSSCRMELSIHYQVFICKIFVAFL